MALMCPHGQQKSEQRLLWGGLKWSSARRRYEKHPSPTETLTVRLAMLILTALGSAVLIGIGDFFGTMAARKGGILPATLWVMITSTIPIALVALVVGGDARPLDYVLGAVAGLGGGAGLLTLYAGYAKTTIGIVGPVAAVVGIVLPVTVGAAIGDDVGGVALVGIVTGVVAIVLIGWKPDTGGRHSPKAAIGYGLGAGVGFGVMATMLGLTPEAAGMLPAIPTRVISALLLIVIAMSRRDPLIPRQGSWELITLAAVGAAGGILLFTVAAQQNLTISGLLLQMAYGVSAVLAILFLGERSSMTQRIGFVGAAAAIALIALG